MKFHYTATPLKDIPLGTVVDGYRITERSHTGKNAVGWRNVPSLFGQKRLEQVLLIYSESQIISEKV